LKPDMTTNVNIHTSEHQALLVPAKCIRRDGQQSFVYLHSAVGAPVKRAVSVGARMADETEVLRGLESGDRIQLETGVAAP
jgi:hypothetical protein